MFNSNRTDHAVAALKGGLGAVPVAGAILTEIVGSIIPNQRIDRIAAYLEKLQSVFGDQFFEQVKNSPDKIAIIEEGMFAAGLTPHRHRIERIAYVIANGLNEDDVKVDDVSKLLHAVKNISDYA